MLLSRTLKGFSVLLKDTGTVNMTTDGQVIAVEVLKPLIFWLQAAIRPFCHKGAAS